MHVGVILLLIAATLLVTPLLGLWGVGYHETCVMGASVGKTALLTPVALLNSPYHGSAHASANRTLHGSSTSFAGLEGNLNASNGLSAGLFSLNNWSVFDQTTQWVWGPGAPTPCSSVEVAQLDSNPILLPSGRYVLTVTLLGEGNTSDSGVPGSISASGYSSVTFGGSLPAGWSQGQGTCSGPGVGLSFTMTQIPVAVIVHPGDSAVPAFVPSTISFTYSLPSGGNWLVGPSQSAGLAFSYTACP